MNINQAIMNQSQAVHDYVIAMRRKLHECAEISSHEFETSRLIRQEIESLGLPCEQVKGTGLIAILDTRRPGRHIALRADIDALPIKEQPYNLKHKRQVMSRNPGVFHACGHDAHSAMLLGTMKSLITLQDHLSGIIYFCFEEGEEIGAGINAMIDALADKAIDTVWGIHVMASLETGKISVQEGPRLAGLAKIDFTIHGQGGHGSRPDLSINPVFTAAMILNNLASTFANQIAADETVTLGITSIQAGTVTNVIPNDAKVLGTYRFFNVKEGQKAVDLSRKVFENCADMTNTTIEYGPEFGLRLLPTINDQEKAALASAALSELFPDDIVTCEPWYASESFHRYLDLYPGVFAFLGIQNLEEGIGAQHHNEYFDVDETVLDKGVAMTLKYVFAHQE